MKNYDVIIIGAGPAGCFSAYQICKTIKNPKILILEASRSLNRTKPCGGQLDKASLRRAPELKKFIVGKTNLVLRYYNDKRLNDDEIFYYYFTRRKNKICLDYRFPLILRKMGVTVLPNHRVTDIDNKNKDHAIVSCGNKKFYGKIVIDASGAASLFNSKLAGGKQISDVEKYFCSVIEFKLAGEDKEIFLNHLENKRLSNRTDFYSGDPVGLHWMIYYEKLGVANIGNGFIVKRGQKIDTKAMMINFLRKKGLKHWNPSDIISWIDPIEIRKKLYADHVLWIGDSAGMTNPYSGHGMPNSSFVAEIIAGVCRDALSRNDFSGEMLKRYQEDPIMRIFIKNLKIKAASVKFTRALGTGGPRFLMSFVSRLTQRQYVKDVELTS